MLNTRTHTREGRGQDLDTATASVPCNARIGSDIARQLSRCEAAVLGALEFPQESGPVWTLRKKLLGSVPALFDETFRDLRSKLRSKDDMTQ